MFRNSNKLVTTLLTIVCNIVEVQVDVTILNYRTMRGMGSGE